MFDYNKFYESYVAANKNEKATLLEQLKVVLFFRYDEVYALDAQTKAEFLSAFFVQLELIIARYQPGLIGFAQYFSQNFAAAFETFCAGQKHEKTSHSKNSMFLV